MKRILILLTLLFLTGMSNTEAFAERPAEKNTLVYTTAKSTLRLYSQHDGRPGYPMENWYIKNTSRNEAIKVTVLYWRGNYSLSQKWTRTFTVEPGEIIGIGNKYGYGQETTYCRIEGARFL